MTPTEKKLREALKKFGVHSYTCNDKGEHRMNCPSNINKCDCGLDEALATPVVEASCSCDYSRKLPGTQSWICSVHGVMPKVVEGGTNEEMKRALGEILKESIIEGIEFWRNEKVLPVPVGNIAEKAEVAILNIFAKDAEKAVVQAKYDHYYAKTDTLEHEISAITTQLNDLEEALEKIVSDKGCRDSRGHYILGHYYECDCHFLIAQQALLKLREWNG